MMKPFKKVDVNKPPRITVAIGLCISLPGRSPFSASGINARAELSAVIRIGFKRSIELARQLASAAHSLRSGDVYSG